VLSIIVVINYLFLIKDFHDLGIVLYILPFLTLDYLKVVINKSNFEQVVRDLINTQNQLIKNFIKTWKVTYRNLFRSKVMMVIQKWQSVDINLNEINFVGHIIIIINFS